MIKSFRYYSSLTTFVLSFIFLSCSEENPPRLYRIYDGKSFGFIDTAGKVVIQPQFPFTGLFQEGFAIVLKDTAILDSARYYFINTKGDSAFKSPLYYLSPQPLHTHAMFKEKSKDYSPIAFLSSMINEFSFSSGLALFYDKSSNRYGYVDKAGKMVIKPQFTNASKFYKGYAVVETVRDSSNEENSHVGLVDSTGKILFSGKYYYLTRFNNDLIIGTVAIKKGSDYHFTSVLLNKNGNTINAIYPGGPYCIFGDFSGAYAVGYDPSWGLNKGPGYFIIDSIGQLLKETVSGQDLYAEDVVINTGKYFWIKQSGSYSWFTLSSDASLVSSDTRLYDTIKAGFNPEGIACVKYPDSKGKLKYGYINTYGDFIIDPKYTDASDFRGPLAYATIKKGLLKIEGYINKKGEFVWSREIRDRL